MHCKAMGDITNNPNVTDTVDNTGMEEVTFYTESSVNWLAIALLAGILYFAFASKETKQKHFKSVKGLTHKSAGYVRRKLAANL
jgi:hypothetical protein